MVLTDRQAADMRAAQAVSEAHRTLAQALAVGRNEAMAFRNGLRGAVDVLRTRLIRIYAELQVATDRAAGDELVRVITDRVNAFIQSSVAGRRGPNAAAAAREGVNMMAANGIGVGNAFALAVYDHAKRREAAAGEAMRNDTSIEMLRVLFVSANPDPTRPLAVEKEQNRIVKVRDGSRYQDHIAIESLPDLDIAAFAKSLRNRMPRLLHFSGHGGADGSLLMRDHDGVPYNMHPTGVAKLLALQSDTLRLVVLNACYSTGLADLLIDNIDCVIGMNDAVDDDAAILFSQTFYGALFDGNTVGHAFSESVALVAARFPGDDDIPEMRTKSGIDPASMTLVARRSPPQPPADQASEASPPVRIECIVQEPNGRGSIDREYQMISLVDITRIRGGRAGVVDIELNGRWLVIEANYEDFRLLWERASKR